LKARGTQSPKLANVCSPKVWPQADRRSAKEASALAAPLAIDGQVDCHRMGRNAAQSKDEHAVRGAARLEPASAKGGRAAWQGLHTVGRLIDKNEPTSLFQSAERDCYVFRTCPHWPVFLKPLRDEVPQVLKMDSDFSAV